MNEHQVLVVGAGPTGLTMALELARRGIRVRIVDKAAEPVADTRALGVQARTLELLARSGVTDALLSRGLRADTFNVFSEGRRILRAEFGGLPTTYPFLLMVPQHEVEAILAARLAEYGVLVERRVEVVDLASKRDAVTVTLRQATGAITRDDYPWVVGSDGARSDVRNLLELGFLGTAFEESFAVADLRMAWDRPPTEFFAFLNRGRFAAFFPMLGGWHRVAIAEPSSGASHERPRVSHEDLQASLDQTVPERPQISEIRQSGRFRINQRRAAAYRVGRVFLAGDAAHVHSVVGAQGMNTGIQDAINLGWKLSLVIGGTAAAGLLDTYETERGPVAARLVKGTRRITRMTLLRNPLATAARRTIAPMVLARPHVQRTLTHAISQLDVSYHDARGASPLGRRPEAGDRAPDAAVTSRAEGPRVHDQLNTAGFTLLGFGMGDESMTQLRSAISDAVTVVSVEPGADAYNAYRVDGPTLILVRPDGYVAARGGERSIREHVSRWQPSGSATSEEKV